jgi:hypothetical protein
MRALLFLKSVIFDSVHAHVCQRCLIVWVCIYLDWLATYRNLSLIPDPVWFRISSLYAAITDSSASAASLRRCLLLRRCRRCLRRCRCGCQIRRASRVPCQQVFPESCVSSSTCRLGAGRSEKVTCVKGVMPHTLTSRVSFRIAIGHQRAAARTLVVLHGVVSIKHLACMT